MPARSRVRRTSRWIVALPFALGGALLGCTVGFVGLGISAMAGGDTTRWLPIVTAGASGTFAWLYKALIIEGSGDFVRRLYMGRDGGTAPEYSLARSLEVRGHYQAALAEYAAGADEYPEDLEPLLLGARLLRSHLDRPDEALAWLQRARRLPGLAAHDEILIDREIVELYDGPLENPAGALPTLARLAERHAGTRPAEWAQGRLAAIRNSTWSAVRDDGKDRRPPDA